MINDASQSRHDAAFAEFQARRERERAERPKVTWRLRGDRWIGGAEGRAALYVERAGTDNGWRYGAIQKGAGRMPADGTTERLHDAKRAAEALL